MKFDKAADIIQHLYERDAAIVDSLLAQRDAIARSKFELREQISKVCASADPLFDHIILTKYIDSKAQELETLSASMACLEDKLDIARENLRRSFGKLLVIRKLQSTR